MDIIVGVPVRVVDDDSVCGGQIYAQTTSSSREEECKLGSTRSCWGIENEVEVERKLKDRDLKFRQKKKNCRYVGLTIKAVNGFLSQAASDASINSLIFVSLILQKVLQKVQHFGHLGEDKNPVASILQLPHHLLEQRQLP